MRLTPARHQATCPVIMPAMRLSPRRCRRYISGRHGRAPDRSPRGRAATAALCSRAVRCDLKPIVAHHRAARVAARARAAAAPNWKVIPGTCKRTDFMHSSSVADVLRGDAETGRKLHNSLGKMPPRVCRQTATHARHERIRSTANPGGTICASLSVPFDLRIPRLSTDCGIISCAILCSRMECHFSPRRSRQAACLKANALGETRRVGIPAGRAGTTGYF